MEMEKTPELQKLLDLRKNVGFYTYIYLCFYNYIRIFHDRIRELPRPPSIRELSQASLSPE